MTTNTKFKGIGFDYGGVIAGQPGYIFDEKISNILGVSVDEFKTSYFKFNELYNKDIISREELWGMILKDLQKETKINDVFVFLNQQSLGEINLNMLNLIDDLRRRGFKVGMFSNFTKEVAIEMRKNGLDKHFDVFLISAEVGYAKPNIEAFILLAEKMGILPTELIFIDDTKESLSSSKQVGFHPILFRDYESLIKELTSLGILN